MAECFSVEDAPLRKVLEERFGCIDVFSDADDLNRLLHDLAGAGILLAPSGLEILIYPSAAEESDVALVTVLSTKNPNAHVAANSEEIRKLASRERWEGDDEVARTVETVHSVLGIANCAVAAVRHLEGLDQGDGEFASACCLRCGARDQLRVEYRYDLRGLGPDGELLLSEERELTDIFCLACGEEVEDVLGPEGPVLGRAKGGESSP